MGDHLSKAGWSWGCVSAIDSNGRTIFVADAHRDDGKRFVVHGDEGPPVSYVKISLGNGVNTPRGRCEHT
jgi:hypothetical protein